MSIGIEIALMEILKWPFYRQFVERIRFNWSGLKLKAQVGDAERWETNKKQMFDHEKCAYDAVSDVVESGVH